MPGGRSSRSSCRSCLVECDRFAFEAVEDHQPQLRHVFDSVFESFTTEPGSLDASVRHVVDAVCRYIVDYHATDLDVLKGGERFFQRVREHSSLEAVFGVIQLANGLSKRFYGG